MRGSMTDHIALVVFPMTELMADIASMGREAKSQHSSTELPAREVRAVIVSVEFGELAQTWEPARKCVRATAKLRRLMMVVTQEVG